MTIICSNLHLRAYDGPSAVLHLRKWYRRTGVMMVDARTGGFQLARFGLRGFCWTGPIR